MELTIKADPELLNNEIRNAVREVVEEVLRDFRNMQTKPLFTRNELAEDVFKVSVQTIDTHIISRPDFPRINVGNRVLFPADEVMQWIKTNTVAEQPITLGSFTSYKKRKEA